MSNFHPYSTFLNNIYCSFYNTPNKKIYSASRYQIEPDSNGVNSIINLNMTSDGEHISNKPFIDLSKWHKDTKDWLLYDDENFPYYLKKRDLSNDDFYADPLWPISKVNNFVYYLPNINEWHYDENSGQELGVYISSYGGADKLYKGIPLAVIVNGVPAIDKTEYASTKFKVEFDTTSDNIVKEFYYDSENNKIYTNTNIDAFDLDQIKVIYYEVLNEVSVSCLLAANSGATPTVTPVVDYYILKLNGQNIRN